MFARFSPLVAIVIAAPAWAQVQDVAPFYAMVTSDKAPMRCNDSSTFYKVAELAKDIVVIVDGEGQGWSRIHYPAGTAAFVRAEEVTVAGESATLSAVSKLKAANIASGYDGSYKALFGAPLPSGTTLKVIEPAKDVTGAIAGYKVVAPAGSKGYVETRMLRKASDAEVASFRAKPGVTLAELPTGGAPIASTGEKPTTTTPKTTPTATETKPTETAATPGDAGSTPVEIAQKTDPNATPQAGPEPVVPTETAAKPTERKIGSDEKLEATFQSVWRQPALAAEYDELLSEFDRAIAAVPEKQANRRRALEVRREALVLRRESRDTMRRQEDDRAKLDKSKVEMTKQLEEIARTRYYTIIGQLTPSLVYNGKELPLMYRIVSVGSSSPRTLGYLKATPELDMTAMMGQVVGIVGEAQLDRSLQLNIITPVNVDVLRSVQAGGGAPTTTPPADQSSPGGQ